MRQKETHDTHAADRRNMCEGRTVYARNFTPGNKTRWLRGTILENTGPVSSRIELQDGTICRRHNDHVRARQENETVEESDSRELDSATEIGVSESGVSVSNDTVQPDSSPEQSTRDSVTSYPKRNRKPPDRFM